MFRYGVVFCAGTAVGSNDNVVPWIFASADAFHVNSRTCVTALRPNTMFDTKSDLGRLTAVRILNGSASTTPPPALTVEVNVIVESLASGTITYQPFVSPSLNSPLASNVPRTAPVGVLCEVSDASAA